MKTAFVLAGGGSLGAIQVGMLQALVEYGVKPDVMIGSSVGAVNAARFAQDPKRSGADALASIWGNVRLNDVFRVAPLRFLMRLAGYGHDGILDPSGLRRLLERHLALENLEDAAVQCAVVASDLVSGEMVLLDRGPAVEAILASAAVPGIFPPVEINGRRLIDGGIAANTPVAVAQSLGADRIIVLPTGSACAPRRLATGPLAVTLQALNHLINAQLIQDVERLRRDVCISLVPPVCHIAVHVNDFSRTRDLIADAYASTLAWLEAGGSDRCEIPEGLVVRAGPSGALL
jgi:NTE family protein